MGLVGPWTGHTACALQAAFKLSNARFARQLGVGERTVAAWHQKPDVTPKSAIQQILDKALEQAPDDVKTRFAELTGERQESGPAAPVRDPAVAEVEQRLIDAPEAAVILDWLDTCARWESGTARNKVATRIVRLGLGELEDRGSRRGQVDQRRIVEALNAYYSDRVPNYGTYTARYDKGAAVTSILTRASWLDLECVLTPESDRLDLASGTTEREVSLDDRTADLAVQRVAETLKLGSRIVDTPLYRLIEIDIHKGRIAGALGLVPFVRYALTMDLLESELIDSLVTGSAVDRRGSLPLRDRLMPDLASVIGVSRRLCSGGALALCAIARPASARRSPDYVLLIQERSGRVLNAARRLAVIPKGFHEPLVDFRDDAQISSTLKREMEEELFGRDDVDSTADSLRSTDPMHPSRLSEPMRWLMQKDGRLRIECTGFGLNLVSGNCEFASLIVIDDEDFWPAYGGQISANWESGRLRQYSSLDHDLIAELIGDVAWSNEGLFALLQGLRRLADVGGNRVDVPAIEWEIR